MNQVAKVEEILRRWDPIGVPGELSMPSDEYDGYAPHIVSMVARGCTLAELCEHLRVLQTSAMGIRARPDRDREIAGEILEAIRAAT
jgi:hypothetical protein